MNRTIKEISKDAAYQAYAVLILLHITLVWLLPHFPTQDGPSHIYNLVILHDLVNGGKEWGNYFVYELRAVPNLGFHIFAYPLVTLFPPYVTEKIFLSIYIILMTVGVPVFLRAFGARAMPLSFLTFPLLFNYPIMMGFYSFTIAVPVMLLAIAAAWSYRSASFACRLLIINSAGFALFYMHLIPFVIFLLSLCIMICAFVVGREKPLRELFLRTIAVIPLLLLCLDYLRSGHGVKVSLASYTASFSRFINLLASVFLFSLDTFSIWQLAPWIPLFLIIYVLFKTGWKERRGSLEIIHRNRVLIPLALSLLLVYLTLPVDFGGGYFFNQRLPWLILMLALPLAAIPSSGFIHRYRMMIFPGIALLFFGLNSVILKLQSDRVEEFLSGVPHVSERSIVAAYKPLTISWARIDPLLHAASHYGITRKCIDAGNYEVSSVLFPVHFRETVPPMPRQDRISYFPASIDWSKFPTVRFLLGWQVDKSSASGLKTDFSLLMKEGNFSLWQRVDSSSPAHDAKREGFQKAEHYDADDHYPRLQREIDHQDNSGQGSSRAAPI